LEEESMIPKNKFPIPDGVVEVRDEYQLNLAHYELLKLKPRGTVLFAGEPKDLRFQFFATEDRNEGVFGRLDEPLNSNNRRIFEYIEKYPRIESFLTITLLQFKMVFIAPRANIVYHAQHKTLRFDFPRRILKTHRRKFIRIPFNDSFPAHVRFQTENGPVTRKLRDLSREGMRLKMEPGDDLIIRQGGRLKQAVLMLLNREIPLGLTVVSLYPGETAGLRIIAISEQDKIWIRDVIRVLMKQILNLDDPRFDDQIEHDDSNDPNKPD
jgi:hypothetical protein